MSERKNKTSFSQTLGVLFSLAGLVLSALLYVKYKNTPEGLIGIAVLVSLVVLSFIFRIITTIFKFTVLLLLLAAGFALLNQQARPKDMRTDPSQKFNQSDKRQNT